MLTQHLRELERDGVVARKIFKPCCDDISRRYPVDLSPLQLLEEAAHKKGLDGSSIAITIQ